MLQQELVACKSLIIAGSQGKTFGEKHNYCMHAFIEWLICRDTKTALRFLEQAEFFDRNAYNQLFWHELQRWNNVGRVEPLDWIKYIDKQLQRHGLSSHREREEHIHDIVVRLLVSPGNLFRKWDGDRHGPITKRFGKSVKNAILNILEKDKNRRKRFTDVDPSVVAGKYAGRESSEVIDEFKKMVLNRLGRLALVIFEQRLSGENVKSLIGREDLGEPSAYKVKREVAAIKKLAMEFAARSGDKFFLYKIEKAMEQESVTAEKRRLAKSA